MSIQPKQNSKRFNALDMLLIMIGAVLLFVLGAYGAVHGWLFRRSRNRAETMGQRTGQYQVQPWCCRIFSARLSRSIAMNTTAPAGTAM